VAESSRRSVPVSVYPTDLCRIYVVLLPLLATWLLIQQVNKIIIILNIVSSTVDYAYLMKSTRRFGSLFSDHVHVTWRIIDLWGLPEVPMYDVSELGCAVDISVIIMAENYPKTGIESAPEKSWIPTVPRTMDILTRDVRNCWSVVTKVYKIITRSTSDWI